MPNARNLGNGGHVALRATAENFGANVVQHVRVVLDGSRALGGGGAWMGKALTKLCHLGCAADERGCREGN